MPPATRCATRSPGTRQTSSQGACQSTASSAPTLVASRTALPPEGASFPWGGPAETKPCATAMLRPNAAA
ncbi:hypothetical protein EUB48_18520 [Rhodoferax sediminis]|uniref:Uncharacterized protein n=1 Tax=Rhodoferax sediminis TaxID=2509614 RepID=A0A515DF64_9BURK|nr:hypothetical protein EUB48_18520 [Rhodoferax sediminis]